MNNWDPSKKPQISMVVKPSSLVEVGLFRLANVKVCHAKFRKICDLFVVDAGVSFFATFPLQSSFFFGCVSCWVRLISIVLLHYSNDIQRIPNSTQKNMTSQGPWKTSTHFPPKNMAENKTNETHRCFRLMNFSRWLNPSDNRPGIFPTEDSTKLMVFWGCRKPMDFRQNELKDVKDGIFPHVYSLYI